MPADASNQAEAFHVMPTAADARPRLVFRVGITGHRSLPDADLQKLDERLGEILDVIETTVHTVHAEPSARALYSDEAPILQFISPLAKGADRISAKVACAKQWRLAVPMPFAQVSYENDFPDTVGEFREFVARARQDAAIVELDGIYKEESRRPEGYLEVGHFVVRHSDILIAIWDGAPANGLGGTGDVVQGALDTDVAVLHIDSKKPHDVSLLDQEAREQPIKPAELAPLIALKVRTIVAPVLDAEADEAARCYFRNEALEFEAGASRDYYGHGVFKASPALPYPGAHGVFRSLLSFARKSKPPSEPPPTRPPSMPANCIFLFDHFQRADCLAIAYSEIHRSAFVLIYLFGALALVAAFGAALAHAPADRLALCLAEFVLLTGILLLYLDDHRARRRERWLDYRLLAEMLREADLLALIGRTLTNRAVYDHEADLALRARWASQAFRAIVRAAGITGGAYDAKHLQEVRDFTAEGRLTDQIRYHDKNSDRTQSLHHRLKIASNFFFFATMAVALVKVMALLTATTWPETKAFLEWTHALWFGILAGAFPAFAYALFGIRNQAEFEIVGRRSERMKTRLRRHRERLRGLSGGSLTSVALGREAVSASEAMRLDVAEWIGIFEMKEAEAG